MGSKNLYVKKMKLVKIRTPRLFLKDPLRHLKFQVIRGKKRLILHILCIGYEIIVWEAPICFFTVTNKYNKTRLKFTVTSKYNKTNDSSSTPTIKSEIIFLLFLIFQM